MLFWDWCRCLSLFSDAFLERADVLLFLLLLLRDWLVCLFDCFPKSGKLYCIFTGVVGVSELCCDVLVLLNTYGVASAFAGYFLYFPAPLVSFF